MRATAASRPQVIENAVETTYPIPEEASSGLLFCCGNVVGIGFTVTFARLVQGSHNGFFTPPALFLFAAVTACVLLVLPYNGDYKRLAAEATTAIAASAVAEHGALPALSSPLLGGQDDEEGSPPPAPPCLGFDPGSPESVSSYGGEALEV